MKLLYLSKGRAALSGQVESLCDPTWPDKAALPFKDRAILSTEIEPLGSISVILL
jgi:hypothetical protein